MSASGIDLAAAPLLVDDVFGQPAQIRALIERHAPYWNQVRYQPASPRAAAAATPTGHPFAMDGGAPPLFRGDWFDGVAALAGTEVLLDSPVLHATARQLFGGSASETTFLYVNVTAPMPGVDAGHVDVPAFRGLNRRRAPGWLLLAMQRSGLFERWAVRTATAVIWFYEGIGGALDYWPQGPLRPPSEVPPRPNTALVGDNDRMFHRVQAVGDPQSWRSVPRDSLLYHSEAERWEIRHDGEILGRHRFEELRVSLSWKAEIFVDDSERRRRHEHTDDLELAVALQLLTAVLRDRGAWNQNPVDLEDPGFVAAVMATFPRRQPRAN